MQRIFDEDVFIDDGSITWEEIAALYEPLPIVLVGIEGERFLSSGHDAATYLGLGAPTSDLIGESEIRCSRPTIYVHV